MKRNKPIVPRAVTERCVTLAAALTVLFGGLAAGVAWRAAHTTSAAPTLPPGASTEEAPAGPLAGLTILVDPGHGGYDGGARARDSGVLEKQLNLAVSLQLEDALAQRGATVRTCRPASTWPPSTRWTWSSPST